MSEAVLVYTTWPDAESAEKAGAEAVAERLAACANVLAPMRSIYRFLSIWKALTPTRLRYNRLATGRIHPRLSIVRQASRLFAAGTGRSDPPIR